ncbi:MULTISPECIES: YesL family protein [Virgibacillus]|uniref:Putative integral membrane protein n=1 Tax=Virgibacillus massiliensis TaxID=1462526 RepID=A0A024Q6D0_9BACI|nr:MULTISPECIES: DUF624 domain-containing protein [Virgibacillus]EQB38476.1 hypothetical protein M948_07790 [Virgibacillus sp. CM-4]MYL41182.1 DUF624 domain-containing protein [Virgibacillus massiliensis]CDQ38014.1 putative integral membrane protein [Virgibacillus massiliensis]
MFDTIRSLCIWIIRLSYVNILWLLFMVIGGVIFGFMPATISLLTIIKKWVNKEDVHSVLCLFIHTYIQAFLKGNGYGLLFLLIGSIFYANITILLPNQNLLTTIFLYSNITLFIVYGLGVVTFFPVYVHFQLTMKNCIKLTFLFALSRFPISFSILLTLIIWLYVIRWYPGLSLFFSGSMVCFIMEWISRKPLSALTSVSNQDVYLIKNA